MIDYPFLLCSLILLVSTEATSQAIPQTYNVYQQNGNTNLQAASEYPPYHQDIIAQNQIAAPEPSIKQILLNNLLSSLSLQSILSPPANSYGPNSITPNYNQISHPVRNVPTEYIYTTTDKTVPEKSKKKKKRKSKRKKNKNNIETAIADQKETQDSSPTTKDTHTKKKTKKRNRPTDVNTNSNNVRSPDENTTTRPKKRKNKETNETNTPVEGNKKKSKRKRKKQKGDQTEVQLKNKTKTKILPTDQFNINELNEGNTPEEYRIARTPTSDPNMLGAWNNLPKEYTRNIFSGANNPFYNPMLEYFMNNYYRPVMIPENDKTLPKKKKPKVKRRQKTKPEVKPQEQPKIVTKIIVIDDEIETNGNHIIKNETQNNKKESLLIDTNKDDHSKTGDEIEFTTSEIPKEVDIEEISREDKYMDYNYYGYIDDYYPIFTDNAAYNADHTEYYIKNYNNDGYNIKYKPEHHTFNNEEIYRNKISNYEISREEKVTTTTENALHIENTQTKPEIYKITEKQDEIIFKSPPLLNSPDFMTRQIDKSEIKHEFHHPETINRYVGEKTDIFNTKMNKHHNLLDDPSKNMVNDVETTFARSKVVKYGPLEDYTQDLWNDFDSADGTIYVVAKSMDDSDIYW